MSGLLLGQRAAGLAVDRHPARIANLDLGDGLDILHDDPMELSAAWAKAKASSVASRRLFRILMVIILRIPPQSVFCCDHCTIEDSLGSLKYRQVGV